MPPGTPTVHQSVIPDLTLQQCRKQSLLYALLTVATLSAYLRKVTVSP
jgi:hypothetical protein